MLLHLFEEINLKRAPNERKRNGDEAKGEIEQMVKAKFRFPAGNGAKNRVAERGTKCYH